MTVTYSTYCWKNTLLWESFVSPLPQNSSTRSRNNEIPTTCHHYPTLADAASCRHDFPTIQTRTRGFAALAFDKPSSKPRCFLSNLASHDDDSLWKRDSLWKCCCMLFLSFIRNWAHRKPLAESTHWILGFVVGCCRQKKTKAFHGLLQPKFEWLQSLEQVGK